MEQGLARLQEELRVNREAAALTCAELLRGAPESAELLSLSGALAHQRGDVEEAYELVSRALAVHPRLPQLHNNLGVLLNDLGRSAEALASFDTALRLAPGYAEALCNRAHALRALGRTGEAIAVYREALAQAPDHAESCLGLGNALRGEGAWEEAVDAYRRLLALNPDHPWGWSNLCGALMALGLFDDAVHAGRRGVRLTPQRADAHWNLSLALLATGDLLAGWREYEWRLCDRSTFPPRFEPAERWDGSPLAGRTLLLAAEQGLGDAIQFIRFVPLLVQGGARVVVECRPELHPLFARHPAISAVFRRGEAPPPFDCFAYLMSLPHLLGTELSSLPAEVPYLEPDPVLSSAWEARLAGGHALRVGLVWAGSAGYKNDRYRSLSARLLAPLGSVRDVALYSLQMGKGAQELAAEEPPFPCVDLTPGIRDLADTAAIIDNLDLVISVDTAVAHLAGALGKPVWLLLPKGGEWRWLRDRDDSPWYPTMRLYRQASFGDWEGVLARVCADLARGGADPGRLFRRGNALANAGKRAEAIVAYERLLELHPNCAEAHNNLGLALQDEGRPADAASCYRAALQLRPDSADVANNLGTALKALNLCDEAAAAFRRALELAPEYLPPYLNLGSLLQYQERPEEAIPLYRQAIALKPHALEPRINLGTAYQDLGEPQRAIAVYEDALALFPASDEAHWNLSLNLLMAGEYRRGWEEYEWRLLAKDARLAPSPWNGGPLSGDAIVLRCEQGLGDTLQFIRYAPLVARQGGRVIVECQHKGLKPILGGMEGVSEVLAQGEPFPAARYGVPLLSLPRIFGTTLDNIPATPYLGADPERVAAWRSRFVGDAGLKVGLVWRGGPLPRNRACPFPEFAPLAGLPGVHFYSLQLGDSPDPAVLDVTDLAPAIADFGDTAAIIANLDLVISIDTSVAHLAGAMGARTFTLLPKSCDWRWLLHRDDSPWYPAMRLFRQERPGDWRGVIERVRAALSQLSRP